SEVDALMRVLTGAERTLVVNNNAAAVMLVLASLAAGRSVIVSRGEAVEIGGGFRIPDVLRQSGARLVEVGTTNRTYARDYAAAIDDDAAAILRVHASNFALVGFTARPELDELSALSRERGVVLIEDVGSGCLLDTRPFGLAHEPTLGESIAAGVDVVCASGDKLLGGPQAGLILGSADVVDRVARHPLARALRADKTCLAGLAATLRHYVRGEATEMVPVWWAISRPVEWLDRRARGWAALAPAGRRPTARSILATRPQNTSPNGCGPVRSRSFPASRRIVSSSTREPSWPGRIRR
ncbi:MAG TPA: L-seryl-tRNA(Sec) selenium transferase, partial [Thermomicrobiales bacterium]|nr:L-seryl-tRNA(Sec) selenium transferase [Thermomicrobiales bacterium]